MTLPVDLRSHLIGDELGHLGHLVPAARDAQRLAVLRAVGGPELAVREDVLAVIEHPRVAVVEEPVGLPLVLRERAVRGMDVPDRRLRLVLRDVAVDRHDHATIREVRDPAAERLDDVDLARLRHVLGDLLREDVVHRTFDRLHVDAGQRLPPRSTEELVVSGLRARLADRRQLDPRILLRLLHRGRGNRVGRMPRRFLQVPAPPTGGGPQPRPLPRGAPTS